MGSEGFPVTKVRPALGEEDKPWELWRQAALLTARQLWLAMRGKEQSDRKEEKV